MSARYFHGGIAGMVPGDLLVPGKPHVEDGCPICEARAAGRVFTVREARAWALSMGEAGRPLLKSLEGARPSDPVDAPSGAKAIYMTPNRGYARFYAARSRGDLYVVEPCGPCRRSEEDTIETWMAESAVVVEVLERGVFLVRRDRRALVRTWKKADRARHRPRG